MRLSDMWAGVESVVEVADLVAHLPRGSAVAEWCGGWGAVTAEEEALRRIEYVLVAVNSKSKPKPPKPPEGVRDTERASAERAREVEKKRARKARALALMKGIY